MNPNTWVNLLKISIPYSNPKQDIQSVAPLCCVSGTFPSFVPCITKMIHSIIIKMITIHRFIWKFLFCCHCERSEAIAMLKLRLPHRFAPRNDNFISIYPDINLALILTSINRNRCSAHDNIWIFLCFHHSEHWNITLRALRQPDTFAIRAYEMP